MIPALEQLHDSLRVVQLPMRASFRSVANREVALFRGPSGWGEFAPFADHGDEHSAQWLAAAIEQAFGQWPQQRRERIPVNAIVPDVPAGEVAEWAKSALAKGIGTFKVKVATGLDDVARVRALRDAVGAAPIRLDANARWSLEQAKVELGALLEAAGEIEYVEQPCRSLEDCARLRSELEVAVAVDEGIRLGNSMTSLEGVADVAVVKAIPLGGVHRALAVADAVGVPVVVSGSLDTSIGLAAGLHLAAALPELPFACGLATLPLLAADVVRDPQEVRDGSLAVERREPDSELLRGLAADAQTEQKWRERLDRCYAILEKQ